VPWCRVVDIEGVHRGVSQTTASLTGLKETWKRRAAVLRIPACTSS
jgi:hypothetical protein